MNEALVRGREEIFFGAEFDASAGTQKLPAEVVSNYVDTLAADAEALRGSFELYRAFPRVVRPRCNSAAFRCVPLSREHQMRPPPLAESLEFKKNQEATAEMSTGRSASHSIEARARARGSFRSE